MVKKFVFLDMDDVLLDTSLEVIKYHKKDFSFENPENCGSRDIHNLLDMSWDECWNKLPTYFWATIPFSPWGKDLIKLSEKYFNDEVYLLTSPIPNGICSMGKQLWVNVFMPKYKNRLIIGHKKHVIVGDDGLLIDDSYMNEERFTTYKKPNSFYLFPAYQNRLHRIAHKMYEDHAEELNKIESVFKNVYRT